MVLALDVLTPLGFRVHCTQEWWNYVATIKHPVLRERLSDVQATLANPLQVRRSTKDPAVLLFYREAGSRFLCVVIKTGEGIGFLITAYPTDSPKRGDVIWSASE
jgi:hypothetical protein